MINNYLNIYTVIMCITFIFSVFSTFWLKKLPGLDPRQFKYEHFLVEQVLHGCSFSPAIPMIPAGTDIHNR